MEAGTSISLQTLFTEVPDPAQYKICDIVQAVAINKNSQRPSYDPNLINPQDYIRVIERQWLLAYLLNAKQKRGEVVKVIMDAKIPNVNSLKRCLITEYWLHEQDYKVRILSPEETVHNTNLVYQVLKEESPI